MLKLFLSIIINLLVLIAAEQTTESKYYIGGVVEYNSQILSDFSPKIPVEKYLQDNVNEYLGFIKSAKEYNVDILVFPEATLNYARSRDDMIKYGIELPDIKDKIAPWEHPKLYNENLRKISKEIKDNRMYVLVNLIEKEACVEDTNDLKLTRCKRNKANGFNIYNTNAVFDRDGRVISRYRKFNLFNEHLVDKPDHIDLAIFETDFGVEFGHFICFDIMFKDPAMNLVRDKHITNILYPSYWFSELPFLTSLQTHFGWAYANNVNFLSAGGNNPISGTGGTGIIAGNKYVANTLISGSIEKRLFISELPKQIRSYKPDGKHKIIKTPSVYYTPVGMQNFHTTENWSKFNVHTWNITDDHIQRICIYTDICCTFDIRMKNHNIPPGKIAYNYQLVANYTTRTYSHDRNCGELYCSIIACTSEDPKSCGRRFKDSTNLFDGIDFDHVKIIANIKVLTNSNDLLIMPNSLDASMTPYDNTLYKFNKLQSIHESGLVRDKHITNILYPSYWFSELPFLTSLQTHFGWAYANNVNFLSAGGNNPISGTGGTGIIAGNKYVANTLISGSIEKRLFISELPKQIRSYKPDGKHKIIKTPSVYYTPVGMQNFHTTENWSKFNVHTWNITDDHIQRICIYTDICCTFDIRMKNHNIPPGKIAYNYQLVANYTTRTYSHDRNCGELYCSIIACTSEDPKSCGRRFKDSTNLFDGIDFDHVKIIANIKVLTNSNDLLIMPNSLDASMTPYDNTLYKFNKLQSIHESGHTYERYQMESQGMLTNLFSFGIYGRNFAIDSTV